MWEPAVATMPVGKLTGPVGIESIATSAGDAGGGTVADVEDPETGSSAVGRVVVMVESVGTKNEARAIVEDELGP